MLVDLFPFQRQALSDLRRNAAEALGAYRRSHAPQVVSFTAPTGAGKTIIMASLIESIFCGDQLYPEQPEAIFVWLSDSPQLNDQSRDKLILKADRLRPFPSDIIDSSFDQKILEDGHIYFLNTQKLSKTSNLTNQRDGRNYLIWETLANTAMEKSDRLYVIIDEAHRGMQGRDAARATTIMQKFLKGSEESRLPPMPVVIGMSATPARFNRLVEGTSSTIHKTVVEAADVRDSGLLKEHIVITYPEESAANKDMAILQAAADDWKEKCDRWRQYCTEQDYRQVNPVLVIQVMNGSGGRLSDTDLDDCLKKVEDRAGYSFQKGQVVHTFGDVGEITVNGLPVPYEEPSRIADNSQVRIVFFKESLSTGWDCPRAETMMSFRHATDATYIAQLLGRMVRTPMQMHIKVDDVLNDVRLFLPHFDRDTVSNVIDALQKSEGGDIPADIDGEPLGRKKTATLTARAHKSRKPEMPADAPGLFPSPPSAATNDGAHGQSGSASADEHEPTKAAESEEVPDAADDTASDDNSTAMDATRGNTDAKDIPSSDPEDAPDGQEEGQEQADPFDREAVMRFINDAGLLSYNVRNVQISNYLASLLSLSHLLTNSGIAPDAMQSVRSGITQLIRDCIDGLKKLGAYEAAANQVKQVRLSAQTFDVFGQSVPGYEVRSLFTTTDTDIERQFRIAETKLENEGMGKAYWKEYYGNDPDSIDAMIDVILFAHDEDSMRNLHLWAKERFHEMNDTYRRRFASCSDEGVRRRYDNIVSNGDIVSKHNFRLPETIQIRQEGGEEYADHLFVDEETRTAKIKLNTWEAGVLAEEQSCEDFVCWIRNPSRASWSLCIPYKMNNIDRPTYPDLIIVRRDGSGYVIDILEPHRPNEKDNLGKAQGFAEYARQNTGLGRIQLIREGKDITGKAKFRRLDMSQSYVRDKVSRAMTNDELDHIFDTDGFSM